MVPCVMYGGKENYHFFAGHIELSKIIYTPDVYVIEMELEANTIRGIIQEVQFHPVTDKILHIDFIQVFDDKPVIATLPVSLKGSSIGIKNGGKLRQRRRYLKVRGLLKDMPEYLDIDITNLDIGFTIKIGDLEYPNLEILDPHRSMVVSIVSSRVAMKGMAEGEEAGEEGGEGAGEEGGEGAEDNSSES